MNNVIPRSIASSSTHRFSALTSQSSRFTCQSIRLHGYSPGHRKLSVALTPKMASFSTTDTGSKPADPYKEKNLQEPNLKEKVQDLVTFMEHCKFGMMTTRIASSGLLTSRCMALAAKVCPSHAGSPVHYTSQKD